MVKKATSQSIAKVGGEDAAAHGEAHDHNDAPHSRPADESSVNSDGAVKKSSRRKISKAKGGRSRKIEGRVSRKEQRDDSDEEHSLESEEVFCESHPRSKIEFMCINPRFVRELCSHCILDNREYINDIFSIQQIVDLHKTKMESESVEHLQDKILESQSF